MARRPTSCGSSSTGPGPMAYPTVFVVPRGEGVSAIARRLEQDGIINSEAAAGAGLFHRLALFQGSRQDQGRGIQHQGERKPARCARYACRGQVDPLQRLDPRRPDEPANRRAPEEAIPDLVGDIVDDPSGGQPVFPTPTAFARGTSRDELISRMQGEQKKFLEGLWPSRSRDLPLTKPEDVVNLAAIVEKEAVRADERPRIAAVYLNRLKKRMRLEADPTVIYGASNGKGRLGHGLLRSELKDEDNPYNTYRNYGSAADADRQSGPGRHRSCAEAGQDGRLVLCRGRHGRACFRRDLRRASAQCRQVAPYREGGARKSERRPANPPAPSRSISWRRWIFLCRSAIRAARRRRGASRGAGEKCAGPLAQMLKQTMAITALAWARSKGKLGGDASRMAAA